MKILKNNPKRLLGMCEEAHIKRILECFLMYHSKPIDTVLEKGITLSLDQCPIIDDEKKTMRHVHVVVL